MRRLAGEYRIEQASQPQGKYAGERGRRAELTWGHHLRLTLSVV